MHKQAANDETLGEGISLIAVQATCSILELSAVLVLYYCNHMSLMHRASP
jgi:hypothetical protein